MQTYIRANNLNSSNTTKRPTITNYDQEMTIYKLIRNSLVLPKSDLKPILMKQYSDILTTSPTIVLYLLDGNFFKELTQRCHRLQKPKPILKMMEEFVRVVQAKITIFEDLVKQLFTRIEILKGARNDLNDANGGFLFDLHSIKEEERKLIKYLLPNTIRFLDVYYTKAKKKEKLKISRLFIDDIRVAFDKEFMNFIKQEIDLMIPISSSTAFKKNQAPIIQRKPNFPLKFQYKEFIEKLMFKIRQINTKYNFEVTEPFELIDTKTTLSSSSTSSSFSKSKSKSTIASTLKVPKNTIFSRQAFKQRNDFKTQLKNNLETEQMVSTKCLNCVQFLFSELPYQNERNSIVDYAIIDSVKTLKGQRQVVLKNLTAFLNKGSGTLIFGCKKTTFGLLPLGEKMNLKEQESYKSSFQNLTKYIQPESNRGLIEYEIDFLPLKQNPFKHSGTLVSAAHKPFVQREFVPETYLMRVKIKSKCAKSVFGCEIDHKNYFYVRDKDKTIMIEGNRLYKEVRLKAYHNFPFKSIDQLTKLQTTFDHDIFLQIIEGRMYQPVNLHQGQCKETLILSTSSRQGQKFN